VFLFSFFYKNHVRRMSASRDHFLKFVHSRIFCRLRFDDVTITYARNMKRRILQTQVSTTGLSGDQGSPQRFASAAVPIPRIKFEVHFDEALSMSWVHFDLLQ